MNELFDDLWQEIAQYRSRIKSMSWRWVDQGDFPRIHPQQLLSSWHLARFGASLMESAAAALPPRLARVSEYLVRHAAEEQLREKWLLRELESIGIGDPGLREILPRAGTAAMVGSQMYFINAGWPVALLGYLFVVEAFHSSSDDLERISRRTGVPYEAMFTIAEHAPPDASQRASLEAAFADEGLTDGDKDAIRQSAYSTARFLLELTAELATEVPEHGAPAGEEH